MKIKLLLSTCLWMAAISIGIAQDKAPENWFHLDPAKDNYPGVSVEKTYKDLLKDKASQTVIVAVIDSGVDAGHEDLSSIMWVNEDEKAGNGIDDDNNGYVDDIHGWNFIGGKDGKNINHDALEVTRLTAHYAKKFEGKDVSKLSKKDKKKYDKYLAMKEEIKEKREGIEKQSMGVMMIHKTIEDVKAHFKKDEITLDELKAIETDDAALKESVGRITAIMDRSGLDFTSLSKEIGRANDHFGGQLNYYYNTEFDPRAEIVGDNYADANQRNYGNNDVQGPDANHGTHVAGIIAAIRNNDIGMDGIANNVRIMSVRCVPDGDERDKDVANAIRYAVDNGAQVINMSFGKSYAWNKKVVDDAVKYAMKKDVLLVHAAGNDGKDNDTSNNFPNDKFKKPGWFKPKNAKNWIEVGAVDWRGGENLAASFSNYGKNNVDVFAPGVAIYSTVVGDEYDSYPGTSMASPMVAGVAALLRSYYPTLTAKQVKEIIQSSSTKNNAQVIKPGSKDKVSFSELSVTGGTLNAYEAVKLAAKTKGKKKIKKGAKKAMARP